MPAKPHVNTIMLLLFMRQTLTTVGPTKESEGTVGPGALCYVHALFVTLLPGSRALRISITVALGKNS